MSASNPLDTFVAGDNVVLVNVLPDTKEVCKMLDLPDGVGQLMMTESAGNIQANNARTRNIAEIAVGALQGTMVANFKDIGVLEGRSASGVFATPIAGPASAQK